jgi:hypothetical protein
VAGKDTGRKENMTRAENTDWYTYMCRVKDEVKAGILSAGGEATEGRASGRRPKTAEILEVDCTSAAAAGTEKGEKMKGTRGGGRGRDTIVQ